jgi:putative copper export protein
MNICEKLCHELKAIGLAMLYFGCWIAALLLLKQLVLAEYQIAVHGFSLALIGALILATFSVGSHAAAVSGRGWAILGDWLHLVAAAVWLGGLVLLALLLWQWRPIAEPVIWHVEHPVGRVALHMVFFIGWGVREGRRNDSLGG